MQQRQGRDRRRRPRGGRRSDDKPGYTPLLIVIDEEQQERERLESMLAGLRFAVVPVETVERAVAIMQAIRPEAIIASESHLSVLRQAAIRDKHGLAIPITVHRRDQPDSDLLDGVRHAIRTALQQAQL